MAALSGCSQQPAVDPPAATPSTHEVAAEPISGSAVLMEEEPTGVLTLERAIGAALARSPELEAFSWELRAADARVLQAGLIPNPDLSVSPENFVGSGVFADRVQFQNTLQLSQLIELGGKRKGRTKVAAETRDKSTLEYEAKRVDVLGGVAVDFIGVLRDQEGLKLTRLAASQAIDSLASARKRIEAGLGTPLEETRTRTLLARARIAEEHARHQLLTSRTKLAARWGAKGPHFSEAQGELFAVHGVPPLDTLLGQLESAPEQRIATAEERVRTAEAALARTKRTPDVTVSAAWRYGKTWDDQTAVVGLSVPLQVFNRYQGDIAAAEASVERAKSEGAAIETRLRSVLFGIYQELLHAKAELEVMATEIVPRSEESLSLARKGFDQGLYSQLDLFDAQRTLIEVKGEQLRAAVTYHELVAELERLLGEAL